MFLEGRFDWLEWWRISLRSEFLILSVMCPVKFLKVIPWVGLLVDKLESDLDIFFSVEWENYLMFRVLLCELTLVHQNVLSCWKSLIEWWTAVSICLSISKNEWLVLWILSMDNLCQHELDRWIFIRPLHSLINKSCIDLIKWEGDWCCYIKI